MLPAMTRANPYYDKTKYALVILLTNNTLRNFFFYVNTSIRTITDFFFFFKMFYQLSCKVSKT